MIEILSNGALNMVQDTGRPDYFHMGISQGGAMDRTALELANLMVGNKASAAGIEISIFPFRIKFHKPMRFASSGASTTLKLANRSLPSWWTACAEAGDILSIDLPSNGARTYLTFAGGINVEKILGSRSTDLKSGFGGYQGRGLRKGDHLELFPPSENATHRTSGFGLAPTSRLSFLAQIYSGTATIRIIPGTEYDSFTEASRSALENSTFSLSANCNRQGYLLNGEVLTTTRPLELMSHGIVPGTVQVPPAGLPVIQMAEANTCGGYPKVATVIDADLWRVAQLRPGQNIQFKVVDHVTAVEALKEHISETNRLANSIAMTTNITGNIR